MTPKNPYRTALLVIAVLGFSAGVLFLLIGVGISNSGDPYAGYSEELARGAIVSGWGSALFGIGTVAILLWLVVSAIGWRPAPIVESPPAERRSGTPGGTTELDRIQAEFDRRMEQD